MQPDQQPDQPDRPSRPRPPLGPVPDVPGWRVEVVEESASTNAEVARRAAAGEPPGLVLVAEHQTAGRGRLDRSWVTPPRAALTFSLLVDPLEVPAARWPWLPLLTGLSVLDGVRSVLVGAAPGGSRLEATLKWPNDVLLDGLKLAGILVERVERRVPGADGPVAVVGVGVNVSSTREELPVATSTSLAVAAPLAAAGDDRAALLGATLRAFSSRYAGWCAAAGHGLRASYAAECSTLGRRVRVHLPRGDTVTGLATGVDGVGRLLVDDGRRTHVLGAGDVVHVRPAGGAE